MRSLLVAACASVALGGCATLFKPQQQSVTIASTNPGADIYVDGMAVGKTPARVALSTSDSHTVTVRGAAGEMSCRFESSVSAGWVLLDIVMSPAWIVDLATGGWKSLDRTDCLVPI
jgi:hypothetical protein